jgi:hypothetical protein
VREIQIEDVPRDPFRRGGEDMVQAMVVAGLVHHIDIEPEPRLVCGIAVVQTLGPLEPPPLVIDPAMEFPERWSEDYFDAVICEWVAVEVLTKIQCRSEMMSRRFGFLTLATLRVPRATGLTGDQRLR